MLESVEGKKVLIVVAHPDDELLGLGSTMHFLIQNYNIQTRVLILGEGLTSRKDNKLEYNWNQELLIHQRNILSAQRIIGYDSVSINTFPDNRFDTVALLDLVKVIEAEKSKFNPDIVFTHHAGDLNIDHQLTFEAVMTACRPLATEKVRTIISFETPSGTEWRASTDPKQFIPNLFISFNDEDLDAKIRAMEMYEFERRQYPHPRSPEALRIQAQRWGIAIGCKYAEAFCLVRGIMNKISIE